MTITLITIAAFSLSGIGHQVWQVYRHGRNNTQYSRILQSLDAMSRDLENMTPFSYARHQRTYSSGTEEKLGFVRNTGKGLKMIEYRLQPRGDDQDAFDLKRRESLLHPEDAGVEYTLAENIRGRFRYYFFNQGKVSLASVWEKDLPVSVEVTLAGVKGGAPAVVKNIPIPVKQ